MPEKSVQVLGWSLLTVGILTLALAMNGLLKARAETVVAMEGQTSSGDGNMAEMKNTDAAACETTCGLPMDEEELKKILTPEQYRIMRQNGTERPFANEYWNNHKPGLYVDRITGEPLFLSTTKFDSGTGWPSFTAPVRAEALVEIEDRSHGMLRTEVRSRSSNSHLGHVFPDGPRPTGLRYCMNSASLRFVAVDDLEKEGFGQYLEAFGRQPSAKPAEAKGGGDAKPVAEEATAMFGAGCFWGVEAAFRKIPGVKDAVSGYAGGHTKNPTYEEVCTDTTGHAEVVQVTYDPSQVSYQTLVDAFFKMHDPTQMNRQGPDVGSQYRSVVFTYGDDQAKVAEETKKALNESGKLRRPIATVVEPAPTFYRAEEYHQRWYEKKGGASCHIF